MRLTLKIAFGLVLGWVTITGIHNYQSSRNEIPKVAQAAPSLAQPTQKVKAEQNKFEFDREKTICDKQHTAFDEAGNAYCMEIPTDAIWTRLATSEEIKQQKRQTP